MQDPTQMDDPNKPNPFTQKFGKGKVAQTSSSNPFTQKFGGASATTFTPPQEVLTTGDQMQQTSSRSELAALESQDIAANKARLEEMLKRPDLTPSHRRRIEGMIKQLSVPSIAGIELTNRVTEPDRNPLSNLARGAAAGAANYGVLGAIDLGTAAVQIALPKFAEKMLHLPEFRKSLHDTQEIIREDLDPQGWWGTGGTAVGALAGGMLPFQVMNSAGMQTLAKLSPAVAGIVKAGTTPGATYLQRLAANLIGAGTVDAIQLADILSDNESTWQQKATMMFTVAAMSGGSAMVSSMRPVKPGMKAPTELSDKPETTTLDVNPERAAEADALIKEGQAAAAAQERRLKINSAAKKTWEFQNPGKSWKDDLSATERKAWMEAFRAQYEVESNTNLDTSTKPVEPGGKVPAGEEKGIPSGESSGVGDLSEVPKGLTEELPPAKPVEGEFEGDQRQSPRQSPLANGKSGIDKLNDMLELEARNPTKFSIKQAQLLYEKLIPRHRLELFNTRKDWSELSISERTQIYKQIGSELDNWKAKAAESLIDKQIRRLSDIKRGEQMVADGKATGNINSIYRGEELLARMEALPQEANADAILTRILDDLTQDLPKDQVTAIMQDIFRGQLPRHALFAGQNDVAYLLRLGAKYDPKYRAPRSPEATPKPATTKPEPTTTQPAEGQPTSTQEPASTTPTRAKEPTVEELKAQIKELTQQRDLAIRERDIDEITGHGNKDAFQRALPTANADPNVDITYFDLTNFKAYNDTFGNVEADIQLKRIADAIEIAMRSMGLVDETNPKATVRIFRQGDEFFVLHPRGKGRELIKAAQDIAGVRDITVGDKQYPMGLRGASAHTFDEVSVLINKVKNGEPLSAKAPRKPAADAQPKPVERDFYGLKVKKAIEEMGVNEIESLQNKLDDALERGELSNALWEQASLELTAADKLRNAVERPFADQWAKLPPEEKVKIGGKTAANKPWDGLSDKARVKIMKKLGHVPEGKLPESTPEAALTELPPDPSAPAVAESAPGLTKQEALDPDIVRTRAEKFKRAIRKPIDKLSNEELIAHRRDLQERVREMGKLASQDAGYSQRLALLDEEFVKRFGSGDGGRGLLQTHPAVTGFAAGYAAGLVAPADPDQDRWQRALYWGVVGAAGATYLTRLKKATAEAVPEYQKNIRAKVKSVEDAPLDRRTGIYSHLMKAYGSIARRDIGITNVSKLAGTKAKPAGQAAGKRAELFGLWRGMTDRWLMGDEVGIWTNEGEFIKLDAMPMTKIAQMVNGNLRTVGDLAAAKRELALRRLEHPRTTGIDLEDARQMYVNTPEIYHKAAEELSKFFRAMRDMSVHAGLISTETAAKMDEQGFYVAIRRLFDNEPGTSPGKIDTKSKGRIKSTGPEDLFRRMKGSKLPFQNPVEAAIDLLPRYQRAAELNRLATMFFDEVSLLNPEDRKFIARKIEGAGTKPTPQEQIKIKALRQQMFEEVGKTLSDAEARAIVSSLSDESLNITNDVVRFYRNGKLEAWRVSDPVARAFKSLQPHELAMFLEGAGLLTKPTNAARVGITANPVFVGWQAFRDIWQFHQNGIYGPPPESGVLTKLASAPLGIPRSAYGSLRGWLEIMFRSGEYKKYVSAGAGGESVASQGLRVARGNIKRSTELLTKISETPARNQFGQIYREIKAGHLREAYASILSPIADAGRFGAYLHERGRGADVIEAIWRSKKAGANFQNRGSSVALQALNRMTLFLNPAIQSMDASRWAFQRDPVGYIARGIAGITIPSMLLWAAYQDDEEIKQLRSTPYGNKFWWFRLGGEIVKVPKPIFDGQVFGASAEAWLDHKMEHDPLATRKWVESVVNDASVNLLPFVGVVPISLATGKVYGLGSSITPPGTDQLDPQFRARTNSTALARIVAEKSSGLAHAIDTKWSDNLLSPAGLDFVVNQYLGGLGSELSKALSIAVDAQNTGFDLPPKEELPFIRSAFGQYPSLGVQAIQEFYTFADRSAQAAATATYIAKTDPENSAAYIESRMQELVLSKMYAESRKQLTDFRRAVEDIRQVPRDLMSDKDKRDLTQVFLRQMIEVAKATNDAARSIREAMTNATDK